MNIVIINSVPLNGGDEALLRATLFGLYDFFPKANISVLCNNPKLAKNFLEDISFDWDWEYAVNHSRNSLKIDDRIKRKIRKSLRKYLGFNYYSSISRIFASRRERRVYGKLEKSNFIIVSPGGYMHDFYGFDKRLETLNFINQHLKKKYFFFGQSLGPFWKKNKYEALKSVLSNSKKVILREHYSKGHLEDINYSKDNVLVLNDIAFYLSKKFVFPVKKSGIIKKVAVNFREWEFEEESKNNFEKAFNLVLGLINEGYIITFISTCQGINGYRDDSEFAQRIYDKLERFAQERCFLIREKFSLKELLVQLNQQDAYIGMRLHGAILSLVAGIPALNIAYEDKTLGIYENLGISEFCFSFKRDFPEWKQNVDSFFKYCPNYINKIENIRNKAAEEAKAAFEVLSQN